jgi:hypothetical protein
MGAFSTLDNLGNLHDAVAFGKFTEIKGTVY